MEKYLIKLAPTVEGFIVEAKDKLEAVNKARDLFAEDQEDLADTYEESVLISTEIINPPDK